MYQMQFILSIYKALSFLRKCSLSYIDSLRYDPTLEFIVDKCLQERTFSFYFVH